MKSSSPLARLIHYIHGVIIVVAVLVALNTAVNYHLKKRIQELASDIAKYHVPAISLLDRILSEVQALRALSDIDPVANDHVHAMRTALRGLTELAALEPSPLTRNALDRLAASASAVLVSPTPNGVDPIVELRSLRINDCMSRRLLRANWRSSKRIEISSSS